jgi:lipooligosaccharide transport system ATP-binding protein
MSSGAVTIKAEKLTKRFGKLTAVDAIDFAVKEGEVFGFLGPNGAGKTSTIRMITCTSPLSGGTLRVKGLDVEKEGREIKGMLGVVPQEDNLDPDFTVLENLLVYARYFGLKKKDVEDRALELLKFSELMDKKDVIIEQLSGGMKRRLLIARALINSPPILILDEPTTGLDPQARHLIWERLRRLKESGTTIILTTHYMDEAHQLCDRLVIMDQGKILVRGRPEELIDRYIGKDVLELKCRKDITPLLKKMGLQVESFYEKFHVYTDKPEEVLSSVRKECDIESSLIRRASLEDVFLKLTGRSLRE